MLFSGTSILLDAWLPLELGLVLGAETPRPKEVRPERKPMNFSRQIYWVEPHELVIWLDQKWLHVGNSLDHYLLIFTTLWHRCYFARSGYEKPGLRKGQWLSKGHTAAK